MLTVNRLSKTYADNVILKDVSFTVNAGERAGLVGPNGCGKTTLLRLITGQESADSGSVQMAASAGYLAQGFAAPPGATLQSCLNAALGDLAQAEADVERLAAALARLQLLSARADAGRVPATLAHLGFDDVPLATPVTSLSGGQKTRLALALLLLSDPQLLLLDEPTNHLDLDMLIWLEDWLAAFRGGALIISHDRAFLDRTVSSILELDPASHTVRQYPGNYSEYVEAKLFERDRQLQAYSDQQGEIAGLQNAARHLRGLAKFKRGGKADTGDKFAKGFFANRSLGTLGRAKHIEQRLKRLLNEERIEKPKLGWQIKLDFGDTPASGRDVLLLEELAVGYGEPLLQNINLILRHGERVAFIGPNGSGKTTLVRTIAGKLPPLAGRARLGANVRLGYFSQEQELLDPKLNALTTLQGVIPSGQSDTEIRNFLHYFLFEGDDVFRPVAELSFGERARLALATLVAQGCNFLLLDEPINHLDIPSRARFEQALSAFEGAALAVVHDRYFIERFASCVWKVEGGTVRQYLELEEAVERD